MSSGAMVLVVRISEITASIPTLSQEVGQWFALFPPSLMPYGTIFALPTAVIAKRRNGYSGVAKAACIIVGFQSFLVSLMLMRPSLFLAGSAGVGRLNQIVQSPHGCWPCDVVNVSFQRGQGLAK